MLEELQAFAGEQRRASNSDLQNQTGVSAGSTAIYADLQDAEEPRWRKQSVGCTMWS